MARYSAADIQKYLRGELSAPEMNALEKAALDDPFLADALEGMENARSLRGETSIQEEMADLNQRLENSTRKKNRPALFFLYRSGWRVAAAVILLLGLATTSYLYLLNPRRKSMVAMDQAPPRTDSGVALERRIQAGAANKGEARLADTLRDGVLQTIPADSSSNATASSGVPAAAAGQVAMARRSLRSDKARTPSEKDKEKFQQHDLAAARAPALQYAPVSAIESIPDRKGSADKQNIDDLKKEYKNVYDEKQRQRDSSIASSRLAQLRAREKFEAFFNKDSSRTDLQDISTAKPANALAFRKSSPSGYIFSGKVLDENNRPLSGVNLSLANRPGFSTISDNNGFFRLNVLRQDTASMLTANYVGYEPASMTLNSENITGNTIHLQPQINSLNEVVVTGYGTERKRNLTADKENTAGAANNAKPSAAGAGSPVQHAAPVKGWPKYETWLKKNKGLAVPDSTLKGEEALSFSVDKKGILSDFKVERSLSPAHDSALIRLIKEGPAWKPLKGRKGRATLIISF
ncbi:MAG TPA: carboxypeptidase-like regulatory domain-containing protein [Puia sp.]|nr:carboxypeptidase-like regulatory domain-containing protein [Puia sp.]